MIPPPPVSIVLASTSPYRRELLTRLKISFQTASPNVDEAPLADEKPPALALRLACIKAGAVRNAWPNALIIGSDQVAVVADTILDKPCNFKNAVGQLKCMRGKRVEFHTAVCVLNTRMDRQQTALITIAVHMREYSDEQIKRYVLSETPYDCAGSARIEGLGIALVEKLEGDDPTALIGLPLIALCTMLRNEGIELP
jgi:septum formation protein